MKVLLLLVCTACCCLGQSRRMMMGAPPSNGGAGGGGAVGPPAVYSTNAVGRSTTLSAGTALTLAIDSGSQTSRVLIVGVSWYSTAATLTNINCQGTNLTPINASQWYSGANASNMLWYLVAPASGAGTISARWNADIDESTLHALVLTNAAQTSTVGTSAKTNLVGSVGGYLTNWIATATNELVVNVNTIGSVDTPTPAFNAGWTVRTARISGAGQHTTALSTMLGIASSPVTNACDWYPTENYQSAIGVSVRGLVAP